MEDDKQGRTTRMTIPLEKLQNMIKEKREQGKTWRDVADDYDVNVAVIWRIYNENYEPKNQEIRKRLGLPEIIEIKQYRDPKTGLFVKEEIS